ncbi:MAG: YdjY domain-containing protein [bacterium]
MTVLRYLLLAGTSLMTSLLAPQAAGQSNTAPSERESNKAIVQKNFDSETSQHGTNSNILVKPGLLASRTGKWVKIRAEATGINSNSYPPEFLLISEASGHDYETVLISFALPSDIHEALVFIGMKPGRPADSNKYRFWPKGERVIFTAEWDNDRHYQARGESFLCSLKTGEPLPGDGFVFVGSAVRDAPDGASGKKVYAADAYDPNCIASYFNDMETVLDVPRVVGKSAVYGKQYVNPNYSFATGQLVSVTLEPEYKDGKTRVADFVLSFASEPGTTAPALSNTVVRLAGADGANPIKGNRIQDALAFFQQVTKDGRDPFVRVEFDGELPLATVRDICTFLDAINTDKGIRIEPPPAGHAYYRAFIPDENLRNPANRAVQPWEVRLSESNGVLSGRMTLVEDKMNQETEKWSTVTRQFDAATPEAMRKVFDTREEDDNTRRIGQPYVFVFVPKGTLYKVLAPFIAACLETRPLVHIYLE